MDSRFCITSYRNGNYTLFCDSEYYENIYIKNRQALNPAD